MLKDLKDSEWLCEYDGPYEARLLKIKKSIVSVKTNYQKMELVETYNYGKTLVLDDKIQSSEADSFIYHEALVMPSLIIHPDPKRILIIGGGEGATLRQVLQLRSIESIVMIDVDGEVISLAKEYLQSFHEGSFFDSKVELRLEDGRRYLENTNQIFDVIIVDVTDPLEEGPSYLLYTKEFYEIVRSKLAAEGIIAAQAGIARVNGLLCLLSVKKTLEEVFSKVRIYTAFIPCYSTAWGFAMASENLDPLTPSSDHINSLIHERCKDEPKFYDGESHQHMFSLPKYLRLASNQEGKVIKDNAPLFVP